MYFSPYRTAKKITQNKNPESIRHCKAVQFSVDERKLTQQAFPFLDKQNLKSEPIIRLDRVEE